jgi:ribosomal protein S18 acetylase RimI-like enzyme
MDAETLRADVTVDEMAQLVRLLTECVHGGASMGFLAPLPAPEAEAYWTRTLGDLDGGHRLIVVMRDAGEIVGSAQLALEGKPNGRHRAEVQKVMVRPSHRRRGIATAMMAEIEATALARGVRLLFLDTSEGYGGARALYDELGYVYVGGIPDYALDPDGTPAKNAIYYKRLRLPRPAPRGQG